MPSGIKPDPAELFVLSREGKQNSSENLLAKNSNWESGLRSGATNGVEDVSNGRTPYGATL